MRIGTIDTTRIAMSSERCGGNACCSCDDVTAPRVDWLIALPWMRYSLRTGWIGHFVESGRYRIAEKYVPPEADCVKEPDHADYRFGERKHDPYELTM